MVKGSFYSEKLVDDSDFPATQLFIHHSKLHSFYLTSTSYIGDVSFGPHTFDHFCSCTKSLFRAFSYARKLFDDMPVRDMGCWNAMLSGYCQNGNAAEALDLLNEMRLEGFYKLANAQKVFDNMVVRDVVSWNSIIAAYEQNDDPDRALASFYDMLLTCSFMLTTCAF
ncbi:hypothetical protein F3Y22_tig00002840pilonHSYRG00564 [Hibiscus syriacus]|uniref:Pentatricopeptide repeat-containing protein n=1 Tax=Hibiscus syriacus TaxID=106335 RepID=A0A6A3CRA2_HIBSY|nr:hypothetical protein F3Y22_tig00002840pilonHSYRG00564 [Hibiscus syriacus]